MSDSTRFTDWTPDTVELVDVPPPPPPPDPDAAVVYEADKVTAYFDAAGKSVKPSLATWAKVWTSDGKGSSILTIVSFSPAPTSG